MAALALVLDVVVPRPACSTEKIVKYDPPEETQAAGYTEYRRPMHGLRHHPL